MCIKDGNILQYYTINCSSSDSYFYNLLPTILDIQTVIVVSSFVIYAKEGITSYEILELKNYQTQSTVYN